MDELHQRQARGHKPVADVAGVPCVVGNLKRSEPLEVRQNVALHHRVVGDVAFCLLDEPLSHPAAIRDRAPLRALVDRRLRDPVAAPCEVGAVLLPEKAPRSQVASAGKVERCPAACALELVEVHLTAAPLPAPQVNPCFRARCLPVQPLDAELGQRARLLLRLLGVLAHLVERDGDTQQRVRLNPYRLVEVVVAVVQRVIEREEVIGIDDAFDYLLREGPHLVPRAGVLVALGGRVQEQRILSRAGGRPQDVEQVTSLVRVQLVEHQRRRVQTVLRAGLRVDGLKHPAVFVTDHGPRERLQREGLTESGELLHHPLRHTPDDARLVASGGRREHLRPDFGLGAKDVEHDGRGQRALGVLASHRVERSGEPSRAVRPPEPEQVHDEEHLRRFQRNRRRLPDALDVRKPLEEGAGLVRLRCRPHERRPLALRSLQICQKAARREAHPLADHPALRVASCLLGVSQRNSDVVSRSRPGTLRTRSPCSRCHLSPAWCGPVGSCPSARPIAGSCRPAS